MHEYMIEDEELNPAIDGNRCINSNEVYTHSRLFSILETSMLTRQACTLGESVTDVLIDDADYRRDVIINPESRHIDIILRHLPDEHWEGVNLENLICTFNMKPELKSIFMKHGKDRNIDMNKLWNTRKYTDVCAEYYYRTVQVAGGDDFREEHKRFITMELRSILEEFNGRLSDIDCSRVVYYFTIGQFFNTGNNKGAKWYKFVDKHDRHDKGQLYKWVVSQSEPSNISNDIICDKFRKYFQDILYQLEDEGLDTAVCKMKKAIKTASLNLGNRTRNASIMYSLRRRYERNDIEQKMDNVGYVIGTHNGILDMGIRPNVVRQPGYIAVPRLHTGYTQYYVTKTVNAKFDQKMYDSMANGVENSTHPDIALVYKIYSGIIIEPDAFNKIMMYTSTMTDGILNILHVLQCVAGGSNGKSVFIDNIMSTLGMQYVTKLSTKLVTDKNKSGSADTEFMKIDGKRGGAVTETDNGEKLMASRLKQLGEINKQGRNMYENEKDFQSNITIMMFSNYALKIDETDDGTWRRIMHYRCKRKFVQNPESEDEVKVNRDYENIAINRPEIADAIFTMLVHYRVELYNKYHDDINRVISPTIEQETLEFRNAQDNLSIFIGKYIVSLAGFTDGKMRSGTSMDAIELEYANHNITITEYITSIQIATEYMTWYKNKYNSLPKDPIDGIADNLTAHPRLKKLFKSDGAVKYLNGYRVISDKFPKIPKECNVTN